MIRTTQIADMTEKQMREIEDQIETVRQERFRQALLTTFQSFGYRSQPDLIAVVSPRGRHFSVEVN